MQQWFSLWQRYLFSVSNGALLYVLLLWTNGFKDENYYGIALLYTQKYIVLLYIMVESHAHFV